MVLGRCVTRKDVLYLIDVSFIPRLVGDVEVRDIELAVNSVAVSHLGIIAYKLQRSLKWDSKAQQFRGDEEANRLVDCSRREPWQL